MEGDPVTIRFLDPPLHEFLPTKEEDIKEIADELCISVHTVATHRRNISAKLEIHTAAGLTIFAIIHHLVDVNEVTPV